MGAPSMVLHPASGDIMRAARVHRGDGVVDSSLYWYQAESADEAGYLTVLLNATCLQHAFACARESGRHFHLQPWRKVPIPRYDEADPLHRELAALCARAESTAVETLTAQLGTNPDQGQMSLSRAVRTALTNEGIDAEINEGALRLLPEQADGSA